MMSAMHQLLCRFGVEGADVLLLRPLVSVVEASGIGIVLMQSDVYEVSTRHSIPHLLFQSCHPIKV